ncbi:hypothetical protein A3A74_05480 [Candidatus Roizmanbacteria bacterium RIFCSPLOWO2_01_FULL_35_13]|uniref:SGNH hydrolase-type esterase domain-containing protein n=1 Tax=Candidatus Roizmanbacteria bacterium RIFCSPLOWO2_01_FULL_35_13 TaxID=1802055 RepID=A0A1F7I954_9BACT|nr:MAG: hypothetical protein A3A74_05480 [Candidatus Roizmanbacteria bacterium RIFCSPLOWO2_01_FULL_35_13]
MSSKLGFKLAVLILLFLILLFPKAYANNSSYVLVGDSIMQGQLPDKLQKTGTTIERRLEQITSEDFENKAVGGVTTDDVAKQVMKVYEKGSAKVVIANGGLNDIGGNQTKTVFLKNWKIILDQTKIHGTRLIILLITPWTRGPNDRMTRRDEFNKALEDLANSYPNASIVNSDPKVGEERSGGPSGNHWNIKEKYTYDGTHFTSEGYTIIANLIADKLERKTVSNIKCDALCFLSRKLKSLLSQLGIGYF